MKTFTKYLFFCVTAFTFLACSIGDENDLRSSYSGGSQPTVNCRPTGTISLAKELEPSCYGEQKKLVSVFDLHNNDADVDWDYVYSAWPGYVPGSGGISGGYGSGGLTVNGVAMSNEEYETYLNEQWRRRYEFPMGKRDLQIACVIEEGYSSWYAMLTEEEISKLQETYGELSFTYVESLPTSSSSVASGGSGCAIPEIPVMDSRVVSYQRGGCSELSGFREIGAGVGIIDNTDALKSCFPYDYDEQKKCNYFAIYNSTSSTRSGYLVLAKDMVLYSLIPNPALSYSCMETTDIFNEMLLVCDDEENTFKKNITLNDSYVVPNWNCRDGQTAPKQGFFPEHPLPVMPKPVMDSRVVSYKNVEYAKNKIVTNTDTLKLWFPNIFNNGLAKSKCNYFAMTFEHRNTFYRPVILSQNKYSEYVLFDVEPHDILIEVQPNGSIVENCKSVTKNEDLAGALLICDDEVFTLKNIIKPYDTPYYYISPSTYTDPNWDCKSGVGAPTLEEIFF